MAGWFAAILGLLALVLLLRLLFEWRRYASGGTIIGSRQMMLRVASAGVLMVVLVLVMVGARLHFTSPEVAFAYRAGCLALVLLAMLMALLDLFLLRRTRGRWRAESYRRLSTYIRRLEKSRDEQADGR